MAFLLSTLHITLQIQKSYHGDDKSHNHVLSIASQFVQFHTFYQHTIQDMSQRQVPQVQNPLHRHDLPQLNAFENLLQLCCKLQPRNVGHRVITFSESVTETNSMCNGLTFQQTFNRDQIEY